MANKITNNLINRVKRYLKDSNIPFMYIGDSKNIMVLKSNGDYHYLVIKFFNIPESWMHSQRHFKIKMSEAIDYNQVINDIRQYTHA